MHPCCHAPAKAAAAALLCGGGGSSSAKDAVKVLMFSYGSGDFHRQHGTQQPRNLFLFFLPLVVPSPRNRSRSILKRLGCYRLPAGHKHQGGVQRARFATGSHTSCTCRLCPFFPPLLTISLVGSHHASLYDTSFYN